MNGVSRLSVIERIERGYVDIEVHAYDSEDGESIQDELLRLAKIGAAMEKYNISEVIARNLIAWDTSKDKREGLLPEIYLRDKALYKVLAGEEYSFNKACKMFNIGEM